MVFSLFLFLVLRCFVFGWSWQRLRLFWGLFWVFIVYSLVYILLLPIRCVLRLCFCVCFVFLFIVIWCFMSACLFSLFLLLCLEFARARLVLFVCVLFCLLFCWFWLLLVQLLCIWCSSYFRVFAVCMVLLGGFFVIIMGFWLCVCLFCLLDVISSCCISIGY